MKVIIGWRAIKVNRQGLRKGLTLDYTHFWTDVSLKCRRWSDFWFWKIVEEFLSDSWLGANSGNVLEPLDRELCCDYKLVHIQLDRALGGSCQRREYCARVHDILQYRALLQLVWQKCPKGGWLRLLMIVRQSNRLWLPRHCPWWLCDSLWLLPIYKRGHTVYIHKCGNHVPKSNWKGVKMRVRKLQMGQQDGFGSFCIRSKGSTSLVWSQLLVLRAVWALLWAVRSSKSLFHRQMCKCCCWSSSTWTIMCTMRWTMRWRTERFKGSTMARIQRHVWWKAVADHQKINV